MKAVAYIRTSTKRQDNSLVIQNTIITAFALNKYIIEQKFIEQISGRKDNRKELLSAIDYCKKNNATLICKSIDRLGRKSSTIQQIYDSSINIIFVENQNIDRFTLQILSVVYENEVTVTRNRIKQTMDKLRVENKWEFTKIGTKNFSDKGRSEGANATKELYGAKNKNIVLSIENIILKTKQVNYSAISNELNKLKTKTINGMNFSPEQVKRLVIRYNLIELIKSNLLF